MRYLAWCGARYSRAGVWGPSMSKGVCGRGVALFPVAMLFTAWLLAAAPAVGLEPTAARLDYQVDEGLNTNRLVREGEVAAHLVLRSGNDARILIAFPAGDSGVGLWFMHRARPVKWALRGAPQTIERSDPRGRTLYGLVSEVSVEATDLQVRQAVLSSVRVLRDYQSHGKVREEHIIAGSDGRIGLRITGLSGETPLTPLSGSELLNESAATDTAARNTLTFLAYHEKLLAGSWRFQTYFGRDTLISVRLLMPVLSATAVEAALGSVLERLSAQGEVAHEEAIGEIAVLDHMEREGTRSAAPVLDYKMIDGDYLLAPVASAWLIHDERARRHAGAFLAAAANGASGHGRTRGAALLANLRLVVQSAVGFAAAPDPSHLIGLKSGHSVGNWRDSESGLGGGRYPYDVNAVLVPAALEATAELADSGLLSMYLNADDRTLFARASQMARVWRTQAAPLFDVALSHAAAA